MLRFFCYIPMMSDFSKLFRAVSDVFLSVMLLGSCKSDEQRQLEAEAERLRQDSLLLVYDPAEADPRLHAYMTRLHELSGFNCTVLIPMPVRILDHNTIELAHF